MRRDHESPIPHVAFRSLPLVSHPLQKPGKRDGPDPKQGVTRSGEHHRIAARYTFAGAKASTVIAQLVLLNPKFT